MGMPGDTRKPSTTTPRRGRIPSGNGGAPPSPDIAARPPSPERLPRIQANHRLRTLLRIDPDVGIGVYTASSKVQRLLEAAGLKVYHGAEDAYTVIPAHRADVAIDVLRSVFKAG